MPLVKMPFKACWKVKILLMTKTVTIRTKKFGEVGDTFEAFGFLWKIVKVECLDHKTAIEKYFKQEGFDSIEQAQEWVRDNLGAWKPDRQVWVHHFAPADKEVQEVRKCPICGFNIFGDQKCPKCNDKKPKPKDSEPEPPQAVIVEAPTYRVYDNGMVELKFGKYKGKSLRQIPTYYLELIIEHFGEISEFLVDHASNEWNRREEIIRPGDDDFLVFPETDKGAPDDDEIEEIFLNDLVELKSQLPEE